REHGTGRYLVALNFEAAACTVPLPTATGRVRLSTHPARHDVEAGAALALAPHEGAVVEL
ncbi:MAG: DUF3459 domain-containing protein, partial [Rhodothermales bacterium]|nr:DUF3459 domain-containing protein [Rhodothermales bacterium]